MQRFLRVALVLVVALLSGPALAKSKVPIKIAVTEEMQQEVMARITGAALQKAGFKVEFVETGRAEVIESLSTAKVHLQPRYLLRKDAAYGIALEERTINKLGGLAGNRRDDPVQKLVWGGMKRKWPDARKMLKTMIFPAEELEALAARAETEGVDPVVDQWMKDHRKRWKRWVTASTNWMKP